MDGFTPGALGGVGDALARPECVLTTRTGDLYVSYCAGHGVGGVSHVDPVGRTRHILAKEAPEGFLPNGIALLADRTFLIANLGPSGGVYHMADDGTLTPRLLEIEGAPLPPTNFVGIDREGRTWVTVSTRQVPRETMMFKGRGDGFILVMEGDGADARIVAEDIDFTNEGVVDPTGAWLYVNETMGQRTSRYAIAPNGDLGAKELVAQYGPGTFPDGLTFDAEGGVWIVSVCSNRVVRTHADGRQEIVLEDADPDVLADCIARFDAGECARPLIDTGGKRALGNLASLAFGGADLSTIYLGTLFGSRILHMPAPVKGAEPVHWRF
ncbi:SMP-30/gluconolactonase/LRE family protein [Acuticoccus sp. M5D2P5]|uniref:SMP-30/gluconolactonase/LRE family protein n=1 Tax=Acuticoccus kalidii TaxID=2910977 RepID=UPI001F179959|nr:SMP-30/gluconolactonase/LRE family protein [Acuticoccus kalidii]MCF3933227.1 SMP-30/gluconolactonase/LRE family protein [Acuticoccus kalidii]